MRASKHAPRSVGSSPDGDSGRRRQPFGEEREAERGAAVGGGEVERASAHGRVAGGERRGVLPRGSGAGGEIVAEAEEDEAAEQRHQLAQGSEGGAGP